MTTLLGCSSTGDIGACAQALARHGCRFVLRCYSREPASCLGLREAWLLGTAGLLIGTRWDGGATAHSRRQGLLDGCAVLARARAIGQPPGSAVFFDAGAEGSLDEMLARYFAGVGAALGGPAGYRVGVTGDADRCAGLLDRGLAELAWPQAQVSEAPLRICLAGQADGLFQLGVAGRTISALQR